jgi:hypothetical protein
MAGAPGTPRHSAPAPRARPRYTPPVDAIDLAFAAGLVLLTLALTGPGLWSEKWGWGAIKRAFRRRAGR